MFGFLFHRWRKASKCKKLLQQLQSRLNLLKNKKYAISRHLRHNVALLIRNNDQTHALLRTQQLFLVENSVSIYDLLLQFTDFIILHFSSIKKHRKLLNDEINEAVSSLVFASARCGELPELLSIRELFSQRYGQRYVTTALQLFPGNLVNRQIKEKLLTTSVSEEEKFRLLDQIGKESGHQFEMLRLEYTTPETETQADEEEEKKVMDWVLNSCSDNDQSPEEVYKFSLSDVEEERNKELETLIEDDYIEEAQVGRDQRVFRFRESSEDERRSSSSSLSSSLKEFRDMESLRYYAKRKRQNRRRRSSPSYCYHIMYNVFKVKDEEEQQPQQEERHRRLSTKHVHPKLPDYDQIVAQFKALRKQQSMHS